MSFFAAETFWNWNWTYRLNRWFEPLGIDPVCTRTETVLLLNSSRVRVVQDREAGSRVPGGYCEARTRNPETVAKQKHHMGDGTDNCQIWPNANFGHTLILANRQFWPTLNLDQPSALANPQFGPIVNFAQTSILANRQFGQPSTVLREFVWKLP